MNIVEAYRRARVLAGLPAPACTFRPGALVVDMF